MGWNNINNPTVRNTTKYSFTTITILYLLIIFIILIISYFNKLPPLLENNKYITLTLIGLIFTGLLVASPYFSTASEINFPPTIAPILSPISPTSAPSLISYHIHLTTPDKMSLGDIRTLICNYTIGCTNPSAEIYTYSYRLSAAGTQFTFQNSDNTLQIEDYQIPTTDVTKVTSQQPPILIKEVPLDEIGLAPTPPPITPTSAPTEAPALPPTYSPTTMPTEAPTNAPTMIPTDAPIRGCTDPTDAQWVDALFGRGCDFMFNMDTCLTVGADPNTSAPPDPSLCNGHSEFECDNTYGNLCQWDSQNCIPKSVTFWDACCKCGGGITTIPAPTSSPTRAPTSSPTRAPTESPTRAPTMVSTESPTGAPVVTLPPSNEFLFTGIDGVAQVGNLPPLGSVTRVFYYIYYGLSPQHEEQLKNNPLLGEIQPPVPLGDYPKFDVDSGTFEGVYPNVLVTTDQVITPSGMQVQTQPVLNAPGLYYLFILNPLCGVYMPVYTVPEYDVSFHDEVGLYTELYQDGTPALPVFSCSPNYDCICPNGEQWNPTNTLIFDQATQAPTATTNAPTMEPLGGNCSFMMGLDQYNLTMFNYINLILFPTISLTGYTQQQLMNKCPNETTDCLTDVDCTNFINTGAMPTNNIFFDNLSQCLFEKTYYDLSTNSTSCQWSDYYYENCKTIANNVPTTEWGSTKFLDESPCVINGFFKGVDPAFTPTQDFLPIVQNSCCHTAGSPTQSPIVSPTSSPTVPTDAPTWAPFSDRTTFVEFPYSRCDDGPVLELDTTGIPNKEGWCEKQCQLDVDCVAFSIDWNSCDLFHQCTQREGSGVWIDDAIVNPPTSAPTFLPPNEYDSICQPSNWLKLDTIHSISDPETCKDACLNNPYCNYAQVFDNDDCYLFFACPDRSTFNPPIPPTNWTPPLYEMNVSMRHCRRSGCPRSGDEFDGRFVFLGAVEETGGNTLEECKQNAIDGGHKYYVWEDMELGPGNCSMGSICVDAVDCERYKPDDSSLDRTYVSGRT